MYIVYTYVLRTYKLHDMQCVKQLFNVMLLDGEHLKYNKNISTKTGKRSINNILIRIIIYRYYILFQ